MTTRRQKRPFNQGPKCSRAGIDCGLFVRFKLTAPALPDAPFSDGGRAGTKPNGLEL